MHIDGPANGDLILNWYASNRTIKLGNVSQTVVAAGNNTVWHAGNDGAASSLDSDLLDGQHGSYYLDYNNLTNLPAGSGNTNIGTGNSKAEIIDTGTDGRFIVTTEGSERLRIDSSGNVKIGGTLPSAPNITLNANGNATFEGIVNTGLVSLSSTTTSGVNQNPAGQLVVQRASSAGNGPLLWRGYSGNTQTSSIAAGGAAEFSGSINSGPIDVATSSASALGVQLSAGGLVRVQRPSIATTNVPVFSGFNGSTENVTLNSDGSANFSGNVRIGGTLPSAPNISLKADGTASFKSSGGVVKITSTGTSAVLILNDSNSVGNFPLIGSEGNTLRLRAGAVDDSIHVTPTEVKIGGTLPASPNITLAASGDSTFNGRVSIRGHIDLSDNEYLYFGDGDDVEFFCDGSHMYMDLNSGIGNFYIRDGSTTRYTFDDNGSFTASGNVTAYSDITLKTNVKVISNALKKVQEIQGITYNRIDLDDGIRYAGVSAQDVEKVMPEVVQTDDEGIKSVAYGNLVSLLIEAIKEQQVQINELQTLVNK